MVRRLLRFLLIGLGVLLVASISAGAYLWHQLRASLPITDGSIVVAGLGAAVTIERDALGVPTITAASASLDTDRGRIDALSALGFVHAQDRFFQMDLQRRQAAGELSALVGPRALAVDSQQRIHRMRTLAKLAVDRTEAPYRRILDAYADGVNAGLKALGAPPPEYLVLRATPEPWTTEDSILTLLAMFNTLQGRQALFEQTLSALHDSLPEPMYRFLSAAGSEWETPVVGNPLVRPPIPGPEIFDLRKARAQTAEKFGDKRETDVATETQRRRDLLVGERLEAITRICLLCGSVSLWPVRDLSLRPAGPRDSEEAAIIGSNNWAVAGRHTATGAALVANDMHLSIGVPIIWYRASLVYGDPKGPAKRMRLTGVTLPGIPSIVVGSNGYVAWGFTNTGGDWSDLVRIDPDVRDATKYLTADGPRAFDVFNERIAAKGADEVTVPVRWTIWGPVVWKDANGVEYAQRWVAHDPTVLSSDVTRLDRARSVDDLLTGSAGIGIPNQNIAVGDASGRIGWTIAGTIPRRLGGDGVLPQSWADGKRGWNGYLAPHEFPRIVDPEFGRIWTANAPVVDGAMLATIGEGGYADGIRARLIRDRLLKIENATPKDLLSVQLDNEARYLDRWRTLLLSVMATSPSSPAREEFKRLVESTWTGRASPDSVAYRLVRTFRTTFVRDVMTTLTAPATSIDPSFDYTRSFRGEGPVWQLVSEKPAHLLSSKYSSWNDWMMASVDASIVELTAGGAALAKQTWGDANRGLILHPLAGGIPWIGGRLNMPPDPLPGDVYTPRAHSPRAGPSERMVVSPGREAEGILQIPTGQSGHPLSPHYSDQYRAWLNGDPTPFLPGPTTSTLTLSPR
ncbi:MAG: penicillin acylase family protein [Vicinamibacterales bacterium]